MLLSLLLETLQMSSEGQLLLNLAYEANMSDTILSKLISIIKRPDFNSGNQWGCLFYIFYKFLDRLENSLSDIRKMEAIDFVPLVIIFHRCYFT